MLSLTAARFGTWSAVGLDEEETNVTEEYLPDGFRRISVCCSVGELEEKRAALSLTLAFTPEYVWTPHITPEEGMIAAQHIFRTPALIAVGEGKTVLLVPDVGDLKEGDVPAFLDWNAPERTLTFGRQAARPVGHVLFQGEETSRFTGEISLSFFLYTADTALINPHRKVLSLLWQRFGHSDAERAYRNRPDYTVFSERTYRWAYENWRESCFREFERDGKKVGAPMMIASAWQSPNHHGEKTQLERVAIWNQAWFSSLRSASGLFRYAKKTGNDTLLGYAVETKELALSFPQEDGLFDSVIGPKDGGDFTDPFFGNSNRNPFDGRLEQSPRHILDMAFTAYYMLVWYGELEKDERLLAYASRFADRVISMQDEKGYYPAWVDRDGKPMGVLDDSPESAMTAAFLLRFSRVTGREDAKASALRALETVRKEIVPADRWEDFETYWSCSRFWSDHVGERIPRNGIFKQCNFSIWFTALGMYEAWKTTGEREWLLSGQEVLDRLLMTQSSFQPDGCPISVVGGFGVMNADAELNDARQSLFAPLILSYGRDLGLTEYTERGKAALYAAFSMMYCPENPGTKEQWEKVWTFFGEEDYGFMMENYGHNGAVGRDGLGIGPFTIYDWGNGAASEGWLRADDLGLL